MRVARVNLAARAAEELGRAVRAGTLGAVLPSERRLSAELGISRPVLREALARLLKLGTLRRKGRTLHVLGRRRADGNAAPPSVVRFLVSSTRSMVDNGIMLIQEYLAERLADLGTGFRIEVAPACFGHKAERELDNLTEAFPDSLWVLLRSTRAMQLWFQSRGLPAIVCGSCFPDSNLPSIDVDYAAVCRHSAGILSGRGHRVIGLLATRERHPGDDRSIEVFEDTLARVSAGNARLLHLVHDETRASVCAAMKQALEINPPPTAIFVFGSLQYLAAATYLAQRRLSVGRDISLVCRNYDPFMDEMVPNVAHYRRDTERFAKRMLDAIRCALAGSPILPKHRLVMADFHDGESLGKYGSIASGGRG